MMFEQTMTRHEPEAFTARTLPRDPYAAWLEQREADRQQGEDSQIRWVYRPRLVNGGRTAV
jgi:hypothetical protein